METISVRCNHCGAPLKVGGKARFVTCQFCNCELEVKRTDSAVFTEEIVRIAEKTERMAESLEVIKLQNEIERMDREWEASRGVVARGRGSGGPKSAAGAAFGVLFAIVFAVICFSMAGLAKSNGAPGVFALVPVAMGLMAVGSSLVGLGKAGRERARLDSYQRRRGELLSRLEAMRKS